MVAMTHTLPLRASASIAAIKSRRCSGVIDAVGDRLDMFPQADGDERQPLQQAVNGDEMQVVEREVDQAREPPLRSLELRGNRTLTADLGALRA